MAGSRSRCCCFRILAAIPLIALAPLFAVGAAAAGAGMGFVGAAKALGTIAVVAGVGYVLLDYVIRLIAMTKVKEAMTAAALLTVVGVAMIMQQVGVSASLGAFIAGALLAESSYRHELEADIAPFEGLLLGLFFTAIGMSLNLRLLIEMPWVVLALAAALVVIKTLVLTLLARRQGLEARPARRLGLVLSQGGEFAFVLFAAGLAAGVLTKAAVGSHERGRDVVDGGDAAADAARKELVGVSPGSVAPLYDTPPKNEGHVIIAGFGRYGQIVARVLRAKGIPFTALDINAEQVEFVKKFGSVAFFGDASRPDILEAAEIGKARAFVLAIDDMEASIRTAEMVTGHLAERSGLRAGAQSQPRPQIARSRRQELSARDISVGPRYDAAGIEGARVLGPSGRADHRNVPHP